MLINRTEFDGSVFDRLTEEHRTIRALLDGLLALEVDDVRRTAWFARLAELVRAHARAEDEIVFPALEGSHELGRRMRQEHAHHQRIEALIHGVVVQPATSDEWAHRLRMLDVALRDHFYDEEHNVFPLARYVISAEHAADLLNLYERDRDLTLSGVIRAP